MNAADQITVVYFTSPIPSCPSSDIFDATDISVLERLGNAGIILADGVRDDMMHRHDDYARYLSRLPQPSLVRHYNWLHESGMFRRLLNREVKGWDITTPYLLFMEHDCPLVGEIPWDDCVATMNQYGLDQLRFMHETHVLDVHEYLFDELVPDAPAPFRYTRQYSSRPHLARTEWYRQVMNEWFDSDSRAMIEVTLHGVAQRHDVHYNLAVYHPLEGSIQRSTHLNGRAGDPEAPSIEAQR